MRALLAVLERSTLLRHLLYAVLGALVVYLVSGQVGAFQDFQLAQVGYYLVAVAGLTVLTGWNGQVSLGHGALMAIGAYVTALLLRDQGWPAWLVLVADVMIVAAFGALVGVAAARLRGPYLAGATLALAVGLPALATRYAGALGGDQGLKFRTPDPPSALGADFVFERWQAWITWLGALATLVLLANLSRSRVGRSLRAVRDDEVAASLAGLHVARWQVLAFVVSAGCAGLAGGLYALTQGAVAPGAFTLLLSLALLTAIVIGGLGSLLGALWGAIAIVVLPELSSNVSRRFELSSSVQNNLPLAMYGLVLIVVVLAAPGGIQGAVRQLASVGRGRGRGPGQPAGDTAERTTAQTARPRRVPRETIT